MNESKSLFQSKTFWTNFAIAAGLLFTNYTQSQLPVENSTVAIALAAANMFLRTLTDKPVHVMPQSDK